MPSDSDSDDWFDKDEDELLDRVKSKTETMAPEATIEYIGPVTTNNYVQQKQIASSSSTTNVNIQKFPTSKMKKVSQMAPLDAFIFVVTYEPDFFAVCHANDSQERVLIFIRILASIGSLLLPVFHAEIARRFMSNEALLDHIRIIATKVFSKSYKTLWAKNEGEQLVDEIVGDMQELLLWAHNECVMTQKGLEVIRYIQQLIVVAESDSLAVAQRVLCRQFASNLNRIIDAERYQNDMKMIEQDGTNDADNLKCRICPTLEMLLEDDDTFIDLTTSILEKESQDYSSIASYLGVHEMMLCDDFIAPLRAFVHSVRKTKTLPHPHKLYNDVSIVLNEQFITAHRHEMLFVDVLGSQRNEQHANIKEIHSDLKNLKNGTMLCFATSCEFDNLILATVTYTDKDILRAGYVGIEILRQYNIGNIYDKQLLMFEAPLFFEPYVNVYNYLTTCSVTEFPMQQYILFQQLSEVAPPSYLQENSTYTYLTHTFDPLSQNMAKEIPINVSQQSAYRNALTQELSLIQGPPGTGKTHVSVHLVRTLLENAPMPLLIVTHTNESLDKFLIKLARHTDSIVRFGSQSRQDDIAKFNIVGFVDKHLVNPRLKHLYYLINLEFTAKFEQLQTLHKEFDGTDESYQQIVTAQRQLREVQRKLQAIKCMFQYYVAREKRVIAMTTTCAAKLNFLLRLLKVPIVIFEEAAEILESHVVACLTPHTQHVIMIGDHMQLKPFVHYNYRPHSEFNLSLFERLINRGLKPSVLTLQYRMRPAIADLLCPIIYEEFHSDSSVESYPLVKNMSKNLCFLTHNNMETKLDLECSVYNEWEANKIFQLAKHLLMVAKYTAEEFVILSPYIKQVELIKQIIESQSKSLQRIKVCSVDSFQGLEAKIVLLSLVRSNDKKQIGFLAQKNRICVALSRAKHGMFVIGNMELLVAASSTWRAIERKLKAQDAITSDWPYE